MVSAVQPPVCFCGHWFGGRVRVSQSPSSRFRYGMVPEWVIVHPGLSDRAFRLYVLLARYGSSPDDCFPSVATLADRLGVSAVTVQRGLRELVAAGCVTVVPRFDGGRQTSNGYQLAMGEQPPQPVDNVVDNASDACG